MNRSLISNVSKQEVFDVIFQLGAFKASGLDGFSRMFYQTYWGIIGKSVIKVVLHFFSSGQMPYCVDSTELVLIPKVFGPKNSSQFRPISLYNFLYKII